MGDESYCIKEIEIEGTDPDNDFYHSEISTLFVADNMIKLFALAHVFGCNKLPDPMGLRDEFGDFETATLNAKMKPYIIEAYQHLDFHAGIIDDVRQKRKLEAFLKSN